MKRFIVLVLCCLILTAPLVADEPMFDQGMAPCGHFNSEYIEWMAMLQLAYAVYWMDTDPEAALEAIGLFLDFMAAAAQAYSAEQISQCVEDFTVDRGGLIELDWGR